MGVSSFQPSAQQLQQAREAYAKLAPTERQQLDQAAWERGYVQQHFAKDSNQASPGSFDAGSELESLELEGTVPATFPYAPVALPNVDKARRWDGLDKNRLSGAQANEVIVKAYGQLDKSFQGYLGGHPPVANWMTYGKYAAREAGVQITRVEGSLRMVETLDPATAISSLLDLGHNTELFGNFGLPLLNDAIARAQQEASQDPLAIANRAITGITGAPGRAAKVLQYFKENLQALDHALVYGNTQIYDNIAPAFDTFMQAESKGQDGLAAVKDLVQAGKIEDPQGFVVQAMGLYQDAHKLQARIDAGEPGLEQTREDMIARADLLLGVQEQQVILQSDHVFGNPTMQRLMAALTPHATLTDPTGVHQLLSDGQGNWADFKTRMGFDEYASAEDARAALRPEQANDPLCQPLVVTDQAGQPHYYLPSSDPKVTAGTITDYFTRNFKEPRLLDGTPRELPRIDQVNEFGGKVPLDITTDLRGAHADADFQTLIDIARANGHNDWANEVEGLRALPDGPARAQLINALADQVGTGDDLKKALAAATTPEELAVLASVAHYRHDDDLAKKAREKAAAKK
ncbi:MAG: hypothetical protein JWM80_1807 [Cyanobacteria bacterium RYN_339]|nr:hypothetical protein [Cyanobacteria bacterium RYN_339]